MHRVISITILLFAVVWLAACSQDASAIAPPTEDVKQATPSAASHGGPVEDYASLVDGLRAAGATVELAGEISQPFAVTGQMIKVNGGDVQVFEFESKDAAQEEAALVSPDGGSVGTSAMSWMATPHFCQAGRLIVLYVGDDGAITDLLESLVGPQFAGGMPEAASPAIDSCPATATDTRLLTNEAHGYCMLYPAAYDVQYPNPDETVLVIGSLLNVEQPRAYIAVQDAAGRTAAQVADELTAGFESGPFGIARTGTTVGGMEAIVLDHMPGQDISRVVVMVNGERLYTLTFAPADENLGDVLEQLEELYTTVVSSFHFFPQSSAATAPAG